MTYATGQVINHGDYNTFATGTSTGTPNNSVANVNTILGVGTGKIGYGQTTPLTPLTPVSTANLVTATQWNTMFSRINTIANHQGTTITTMPTVVTGNEIAAIATLNSNLTAIYNGFGKAYSTTTGNTLTSSITTAWTTQASFAFNVTFASGDAARYFFNAGGSIQLTFSRTGGTGSPEDLDWTTTCNNCGTLVFGYNSTTKVGGASGGTGSIIPPVAIGYWQMTTTNQNIQKQYSTGAAPYGSTNYIISTARSNGTSGSNGDLGNVLTFTSSWVNAGGSYRTVNGTSSAICTVINPATSYLTNTWGSPTVVAYSGYPFAS